MHTPPLHDAIRHGCMALGYKASPHAAHARRLSLSLSLRHHWWPSSRTTPREEGREGIVRGGSEPPRTAEATGAKGDAVVVITVVGRHYTALLPELPGRNSTLHRHPFFHSTHGEPRFIPCSPLDLATPAIVLHTVSA